jgi:hypothetical protein
MRARPGWLPPLIIGRKNKIKRLSMFDSYIYPSFVLR